MKLMKLAVIIGITLACNAAQAGRAEYESFMGKQEWASANEELQRMVDGGDAWATAQMGVHLILGDIVKEDHAKAAVMFKKAADMGNADGYAGLGIMQFAGYAGVQPDKKSGCENVLKADAESVRGKAVLGQCYDEGVFGKVDKDAAIKLWTEAMNAGIKEGGYRLGMLYATGDGVPRDVEKAIPLLEGSGLAVAALEVGKLYLEDTKLHDATYAMMNLEEAATHNVRAAIYPLAELLAHGDVKSDFKPQKVHAMALLDYLVDEGSIEPSVVSLRKEVQAELSVDEISQAAELTKIAHGEGGLAKLYGMLPLEAFK